MNINATMEEAIIKNGFRYEIFKSYIEKNAGKNGMPSDYELFRCACPEYEKARSQNTHYYALLRLVEKSESSTVDRLCAILLTFKCVMDDIGNDYKRLTEFAVAIGRRMWELFNVDNESILARKYHRMFNTIKNRAISMFGEDKEKIGHFHWVLD